jgi:hypothetical protein
VERTNPKLAPRAGSLGLPISQGELGCARGDRRRPEAPPDNAKVAIIKGRHVDPPVDRSYAEMAVHYDMAALPTRPRKPKHKVKVEAAVLIVKSMVLALRATCAIASRSRAIGVNR